MLDWRHRLCIVGASLILCKIIVIFTQGRIIVRRAQEFAKQGCIVYASSRRVDTIADFADPRTHKIALDVTSEENIQKVIQEIINQEGKIDVVVNNAGIISPGRASWLDDF